MVNTLNLYILQAHLVAALSFTMKPATLTMNRLTMFANMIVTSDRADCGIVRSVEIALKA